MYTIMDKLLNMNAASCQVIKFDNILHRFIIMACRVANYCNTYVSFLLQIIKVAAKITTDETATTTLTTTATIIFSSCLMADSIGGPTLGVDIELGGSVVTVVLSVSRDSVVVV